MFPTVTRRAIGLLALALSAALLAAACQAQVPPSSSAGTDAFGAGPAPSTDPTGTTSTEPLAPGPVDPGPTVVGPTYPDTATLYAKAVVNAWTGGQIGTLGSLTTPLVQEQLLEIPGTVNDDWVYLRCEGTARSSYCFLANTDGAELRLRISHALLGQAHAATEESLDLISYPNTALAYVKEFVAAWQVRKTPRMLKLSKHNGVDKVGKAPASPTYPGTTPSAA
jgi:hypothetical protein